MLGLMGICCGCCDTPVYSFSFSAPVASVFSGSAHLGHKKYDYNFGVSIFDCPDFNSFSFAFEKFFDPSSGYEVGEKYSERIHYNSLGHYIYSDYVKCVALTILEKVSYPPDIPSDINSFLSNFSSSFYSLFTDEIRFIITVNDLAFGKNSVLLTDYYRSKLQEFVVPDLSLLFSAGEVCDFFLSKAYELYSDFMGYGEIDTKTLISIHPVRILNKG